MYESFVKELEDYYRRMDITDNKLADEQAERMHCAVTGRIYEEMDEFYRKYPDTPPVLLKAKLHTLIAKHFEPVIFRSCPFFFEMGLRESTSWGKSEKSPSFWLKKTKKKELETLLPDCAKAYSGYMDLFYDMHGEVGLCSKFSPFDTDHNTLGYTQLFKLGIKGIMESAQSRMRDSEPGSSGYIFCKAVLESCRAIRDIAAKFADKAECELKFCTDEKSRRNMKLIALTARKIPLNPPETFFEGLAFILFMRETVGTLENIGISHLGHVDRLLWDLYEKDLKSGRISEAETKELIGIWMSYTDVKFNLKESSWPETSTCIQLGGCDENGSCVYNRLTEMFIEVHSELKLVNPKLNCRFSKNSPDEYLALIGKYALGKHNSFSLCNDDVLIEGLVRSGVQKNHARLYVNGGCQETILEGFGHTEGANLYFSTARFLDLFLRRDEKTQIVKSIEKADTFEEFYSEFIGTLKSFTETLIGLRNEFQSLWKDALLSPMYSATQSGCIENGADYVYGGARYNFTTVCILGLATTVDSLYAIKTLVYDKKLLTLEALNEILADNWNGHEELRRTAVSLPKYGRGSDETDILTGRFLDDICSIYAEQTNERGGRYIVSTFVYYYYKFLAENLRATPDGRKNGDLMSPGISPSQLGSTKDVTAPLKSMKNIDFTVLGGGNAVLDMQLPASSGLSGDIFKALIRVCSEYGCPTLQPNTVSVEELRAAKTNPEKYRHLIVRICGLSAYFTALKPDVQDEIINRTK